MAVTKDETPFTACPAELVVTASRRSPAVISCTSQGLSGVVTPASC